MSIAIAYRALDFPTSLMDTGMVLSPAPYVHQMTAQRNPKYLRQYGLKAAGTSTVVGIYQPIDRHHQLLQHLFCSYPPLVQKAKIYLGREEHFPLRTNNA
jgi:hypothetical protein